MLLIGRFLATSTDEAKTKVKSNIAKFIFEKKINFLRAYEEKTVEEVHTFSGSVLSLNEVRNISKKSGTGSLILNILKEMGNVSLLSKNIGLLFITLSNFFIFSGYFIPFLFIPIRAKQLDIADSSFILGLIGKEKIEINQFGK